MGTLLFCRDGILRERHSVYNRATKKHKAVLIPVEELRGASLLSVLNHCVEFADGLIVKEFFENLAPFSEQVSELAQMDFPAFLVEARRPSRPQDPNETEIEAIEIFCDAVIAPVPAYEGDIQTDDSSLASRIPGTSLYRMRIPKALVSDRLELELAWDYLAIYKAPYTDADSGITSRGCSVDYSPLDTWNALPMRLAATGKLYDGTPNNSHLSCKDGLIEAEFPGVKSVTSSDGRVTSRSIALEAQTPTLFDAILHGFLREIGFHVSPATRDEKAQEIQEALSDLDIEIPTEDQAVPEILDIPFREEADRKRQERDARNQAHPYEEDDLHLLARAGEIEKRKPGSVIYTDD